MKYIFTILSSAHTSECLKAQALFRLESEAWQRKYPKSCKTCGATGEVHWTENGAPHGEGFWPMDMADFCESCIGKGVCPRCGVVNGTDWAENEGACKNCKWTPEIGRTVSAPSEPECCCWEIGVHNGW